MKQQTVVLLCLIGAALAPAQTAPPAQPSAQPTAQPAAHAAAAAQAAGLPGKVGVIEIQAAILNTRDGQRASAEFKVKFDPRKKELDQKAAEIRDLQSKLQSGGAAMADAAKADLQRQIDSKTKSYNRDMEDANAEFQSEQQKVLGDLEQKMMQVIDKYAQTNGYAVIIDVSNPQTPVMYAAPSSNITKEIVDLYDKSNPGGAATRAPAPSTPKPMPAPVKKQP